MNSTFNDQGSELFEMDDLFWKIIDHKTDRKYWLRMSSFPSFSVAMLKAVIRSLFSKNKLTTTNRTFAAVKYLQSWLGERVIHSYDQLSVTDYHNFKNWLRDKKLSSYLVQNTISSLKLLWDEAVLLKLKEATSVSLQTINEFLSGVSLEKSMILLSHVNIHGSKLLELRENLWKVIYNVRESTAQSHTIDWNKLPPVSQIFVKTISKAFFDQNRISIIVNVSGAFIKLHQWINNPMFFNYDTLTESDYSTFDEWLKGQNLNLSTRRSIFTFIKAGFNEALSINRPEVSGKAVTTISDVMPRRFRNVNIKSHLKKSEQILTSNEADRIYEMIDKELRLAQTILDQPMGKYIGFIKNPDPIGYRYKRSVDLVVVVAIWLALDCGLRAHEICNLELSDVIEDKSEHGFHKLRCKGSQSKPERYIPLDERGLYVINILIEWTKSIRVKFPSEALFIDWTLFRNKIDQCTALRMTNSMLNKRIDKIFCKYDLRRDDGTLIKISLSIFRKTLGAHLAASTQNKEKVRRAMGHESFNTTEGYYLTIARSELTYQVSEALRAESRRLAILYKTPVVDLNLEMPDAAENLRTNPHRDIEFGICNVNQTTIDLSKSCRRAPTCLECKFLVPEARKRQNYVLEMERYIELAESETDERTAQQRLKRAAMAQGYIQLIDQRLKEESSLPITTRKRRKYK
jgi:integrase